MVTKKISILPIKRSKYNLIKQSANSRSHYWHIGTLCTQDLKGPSPNYGVLPQILVLLLLGYLGLVILCNNWDWKPCATTILHFWNKKEVLVLTWPLYCLRYLLYSARQHPL